MGFEREAAVAIAAAIQAASEIRALYRGTYEVREKGHGNPVTEADLRANEVLRDVLAREFPSYRWLSEESVKDAQAYGDEPTWVIDPLDGTADFVAGLPEFAVSVALVSEGRARVAAVVNPATGDAWSAREGGGATRNGRPTRVLQATDLAGETVLVSRSEHRRGDLAAYSPRLHLSPVGSIAYKLCLVASGEGAAVFTSHPRSLWDVAGGALVLAEAGGRVTDGEGRPIDFHPDRARVPRIIGAAPGVYEALSRVLSTAP
ncbi:MAG: 3'(2'),5'-bisphosphate nucleotidase CysQ [Planctomycetota bacterium]